MPTLPHPRKRRKPEERSQILRAYHRSELSQRAFAAEAGISLSTLQLWLRGTRIQPRSQPAFVEVPNVLASIPAPLPYRLRWPSGLVLEIGQGFRPEDVAAL